MPFAKRGDVVHSEATSGFNNQKKSLLINGLAALGDSLHPLHVNKKAPFGAFLLPAPAFHGAQAMKDFPTPSSVSTPSTAKINAAME